MLKRAIPIILILITACTAAQSEVKPTQSETPTQIKTLTLQATEYVISLTPDPDYDPLVEPEVSEDPSEFELGRNWYWHNCMTCHGDVGQGLTEEFRKVWPEDHQNCWAHGCHVGNSSSEGFTIPRYVPALVTDDRLAKFTSEKELSSYLKSTHPPQTPGILSDEEYRLIAKFVFILNGR